MNEITYMVIEGTHENPNDKSTIIKKTKKIYGPFNKKKAEDFAAGLIQKNVDNYYHRAWVVKGQVNLNDICEECKNDSPTVIQNLMMHGYKICDSCKLSKTIFPI